MPCQHKHTLPSQTQIRYSGCLCDPYSSASSNEVAVQIEIQISICIGNLEGIFQSRVEEGKRSICERKLLYITSFVTVEVNCWQADFVNEICLPTTAFRCQSVVIYMWLLNHMSFTDDVQTWFVGLRHAVLQEKMSTDNLRCTIPP